MTLKLPDTWSNHRGLLPLIYCDNAVRVKKIRDTPLVSHIDQPSCLDMYRILEFCVSPSPYSFGVRLSEAVLTDTDSPTGVWEVFVWVSV